MSIKLANAGTTYNLDPTGHTLDATGKVNGTWSVDPQNRVVVDDGTNKTNVPANWSFVNDQYGNPALTMADTAGNSYTFEPVQGLPNLDLSLVRNAIQVVPDTAHGFKFVLQATFGLDANLDLTVTLPGIAASNSTLVGLIIDASPEFNFEFFDAAGARTFVFDGQWAKQNAGTLQLQYVLTPNAGTGGNPFTLPGNGFQLGTGNGSLSLNYTKNGATQTFGIDVCINLGAGTTTNAKLEIQFLASTDGVTPKYSLTLDYTAAGQDFKTGLKITLGVAGTAGAQTITIAGQYSLVQGPVSACLGFSYSQTPQNAVQKNYNYALSVQAAWSDTASKSNLVLSFTLADGTVQTLNLTGNFTLGSAAVQFGIAISNDGGNRKVTGFLTISF